MFRLILLSAIFFYFLSEIQGLPKGPGIRQITFYNIIISLPYSLSMFDIKIEKWKSTI